MTGPTLPPLDKYVALDCETVRTPNGQVLARVGMVNHAGDILLDSYVFVHSSNVVDWLTKIHGIKPGDLDGAPTFDEIQPKIKELLKDKIVVGHALWNDLSWIKHRHPYEDMRDTSLYYPLRKQLNVEREGDQGSLKKLAKKVLDTDVQTGFHCPVEDARTAMAIFMTVREQYEAELAAGKECIAGLPNLHQVLTNSTSAFAFGGTISGDVLRVEDVKLFHEGDEASGIVKLPLSPDTAATLFTASSHSSHGVGDQTVYDPTYRQAKEITVPNFSLSPDPTTHAAILGAIKTTLVHPRDLRAELYKLNVYGEGGFFKPHRDTPRGKSHIGTLLLSLPSAYTGGELIVRHNGHSQPFDWSKDTTVFHWAFLYSDCEHEVLPVTSGHRVTIQYNVFDTPACVDAGVVDTRQGWLKDTLASLVTNATGPMTLGFALQHAYPFARPRSYEYRSGAPLEDRLKGSDNRLLRAIQAAGLAWQFMAVYENTWYNEDHELWYKARDTEDYRLAEQRIDEEQRAQMPPNESTFKGDELSRQAVQQRQAIRRRLRDEEYNFLNDVREAIQARLKAQRQEELSKPFRYRLFASHKFGLLDGENPCEQYDTWGFLKKEGVKDDPSVRWIVTPTRYPEATTYLTYGNEAQSETMYSAVAILVYIDGPNAAGEEADA